MIGNPPDIWIEWKSVITASTCARCVAVDQCWFYARKMPRLPQHFRCRCSFSAIKRPIPNKTAFAECDIRKFTEYIFAEKHTNEGKRDLFESWGYKIENSEKLRDEICREALYNYCNADYELDLHDRYGQRIRIRIGLAIPAGGVKWFNSAWMVEKNGQD
jgi:hypothetical protein